jgi:AAA15 family ATPase/GTPase
MRKFGIKNFRVFQDYLELNFKPLTLLVGPNNSGKSTVYKALKFVSFKETEQYFESFFFPEFNLQLDSRYSNNFDSIASNPSSLIEMNFEVPVFG